jgi:cold shock CspA family protein
MKGWVYMSSDQVHFGWIEAWDGARGVGRIMQDDVISWFFHWTGIRGFDGEKIERDMPVRFQKDTYIHSSGKTVPMIAWRNATRRAISLQHGTVKRFDPARNFGHIQTAAGSIFVHGSNATGELTPGARVRFRRAKGTDRTGARWEAVDVTVIEPEEQINAEAS